MKFTKLRTYVAGIALSIVATGCWDMEDMKAGPDGGDNGIGTSPLADPPDPADGIGTSPEGIGTSPDGIGTSPEAKDPGCRDSAGRCNDDGVGTSPGGIGTSPE